MVNKASHKIHYSYLEDKIILCLSCSGDIFIVPAKYEIHVGKSKKDRKKKNRKRANSICEVHDAACLKQTSLSLNVMYHLQLSWGGFVQWKWSKVGFAELVCYLLNRSGVRDDISFLQKGQGQRLHIQGGSKYSLQSLPGLLVHT